MAQKTVKAQDLKRADLLESGLIVKADAKVEAEAVEVKTSEGVLKYYLDELVIVERDD